jgi:hypothetical protein
LNSLSQRKIQISINKPWFALRHIPHPSIRENRNR